MGGNGGFNPLSIVNTLVFGPEVGGLVAMGTAGSDSGKSSGGEAAAQQADQTAAEARRKADRKKAEAALLAKARQADRAEQLGRDSVAESLGEPQVATPGLKTRLGQ
jgi:hypothetical protein